jgi:TolB-like protein
VEVALTTVLARNPVDRYATASELTAALTAKGVRPPRPARPTSRIPWRAVAAVAVVLGVVGGVVARFVRPSDVIPPAAWVMAVAPFVPSTADTALARLGQDLVVTLSTNLNGVGRIRVVDAMAVLSQTRDGETVYDREAAAAMARRLGAGSFVHGSLVRLGPDVRLDFGVFTSDSLEELTLGSASAPGTDIVALTDSASWTIVRRLSRTEAVPSLQGLTTTSLPALRAYLDGERAAAEGRWEDALAAYRESASADSTFWEVYFAFSRASLFENHEGTDLNPTVNLQEHFYELPRSLQECWKADWPWNPWRDPDAEDPPTTLSYYLAHYASAVELYPECEGVWWEYADKMVHFGSKVGYSKADKQAALEAAIQRFPQVTWLWGHLLWVTQGRDSIAVGRALEALTRLDPHSHRFMQRLLDRAYRTGIVDTALADSTAELMRTDDDPSVWYVIEYGFPREAIEVGRRVLPSGAAHRAKSLPSDMVFAWAARGAWDSALVVQDRLLARAADGAELDVYRMATVGTWLGALPPSAARERRGPAMASLDESAGVDSAEVWWLDGLLAIVEEDEQGLTAALSALRQMDAATKRATEVSLQALQLDLAGNTVEAVRLLSEREWSDTDRSFGNEDYRGHPYVRPVNRLVLARWFLASGDTAQAKRMLSYHEVHMDGGRSLAAATIAPIAYLELGQIEEARGHDEIAAGHYHQVVRRYDAAVPALRHVITEAEAGIGRIALRR